jgi:uncharacterized protein with ParB-like and HNH nuclease domain
MEQGKSIWRVVCWHKYKDFDEHFEDEDEAREVYEEKVDEWFEEVMEEFKSQLDNAKQSYDEARNDPEPGHRSLEWREAEYKRHSDDWEKWFNGYEEFPLEKKEDTIEHFRDMYPYKMSVKIERISVKYKKRRRGN